LHVYGFLELLTGALAFCVPLFFEKGSQWLLQVGAMNSWKYLTSSSGIIALSLLPSCFLMGCTTPVMMAHIKKKDPAAETTFSFLYLANVLGAVTGTLLTAAVFIELWGFKRSTYLAVDLNLALGLLALAMASRAGSSSAAESRTEEAAPSSTMEMISRPYLRGLLFFSGFTAMSFEVLWTRAFTAVVGTTVYAFAIILGVYLSATWAGSALYRHHLHRKTPWPFTKVVVILAMTSFLPALSSAIPCGSFYVLNLLSIVPCCWVFGYLLPGLVDLYSRGQSQPAGQAYAINIAGCVAGPLLASYIFLPYLGAKTSMILLSLALLVLGIGGAVKIFKTFSFSSIGVTALLLAAAFLGPATYDELAPDAQVPVVRRDYAATVVSSGSGMKKSLLVNGVGITILTPLTKVMADLPLTFHQGPSQKALIICFGMGTTFRSLCSWGISTTAVELVPSVKAAFPYYFADAQAVLKNPLAHVVIDDGRRFLKRTGERFDVVTLDPPPPPEAAGSSLLYSREFYELVKARMAPGGILQQWWPGGERRILYATARTLAVSFPYVRVYKGRGGFGFHFLASNQPLLAPTIDQFIARMPPAAQADLGEWSPQSSLRSLVEPIMAVEIPIASLAEQSFDIITDDHPYNEYYLLRRLRDLRRGLVYGVR
jgi:predicted membrane-bound spermidine synthase